MIFTDGEIKAAEQLVWEMLDSYQHAYCPILSEYAFFYYNGKVVMDPWVNENKQELPWPDHEDETVSVNPVQYYGADAIENYLVRLFLLKPDAYPSITKKIRNHVDENGLLVTMTSNMPIEVYFAIDDAQAKEEHRRVCMGNALPDSGRIYFDMLKLPQNLVTIVSSNWEQEITFHADDAAKVMNLLYPEGCTFDYMKHVNRCQDKIVRLIGFGD